MLRASLSNHEWTNGKQGQGKDLVYIIPWAALNLFALALSLETYSTNILPRRLQSQPSSYAGDSRRGVRCSGFLCPELDRFRNIAWWLRTKTTNPLHLQQCDEECGRQQRNLTGSCYTARQIPRSSTVQVAKAVVPASFSFVLVFERQLQRGVAAGQS